MATNIFSLKTKDTNYYIYCNMIGQHIENEFIDAYFDESMPENGGDKPVCYKTVLGYTMRNACLYFQSKIGNVKIRKMVIDFAICSKDGYVIKPTYQFVTAQETAWTGSLVAVRNEQIGNRYTTYFRATFTDSTTNGTNMCSIHFQTNGVFVYDAQVEYDGTD